MADTSPMCSIIVANASGMMVMMAVMARPASNCAPKMENTVSFQVNGMPIHAASATPVKSTTPAADATTYGENTGVLALTKVFDPRVIRLAALFAIAFSFCPKFAAVIAAMPACVIGGVSLVLYVMISAVGIRNLVENHVDFMKSRNVLITALILVLSLGIAYSTAGAIVVPVGEITISLSGLAVGSIVGIVLNMILPGHEDVAGASDAEDEEMDGPLPLEGNLEELSTQNG